MTTQTCCDCGKRGPNAGDFGGQCAECYAATVRDWISGDDEVDNEPDDRCLECQGSGLDDDDDLGICPMCGGSG